MTEAVIPSSAPSEKQPISVVAALERAIGPAQSKRVWVGFSGGLDSTVLLAAACSLRVTRKIEVAAVHVHHGLQAAADEFAIHCERIAQSFDVPLTVRRVLVENNKDGVEASARAARFGVFVALPGEGECLLLGHHRQDDTETLLLRLLRGVSARGLSGIPRQRPLGAGRLIHPFLDLPKTALRQYADEHRLEWIEDPTNASLDFDRNRVRALLVPLLATHWPDYEARLARLADQTQAQRQLLTEVGRQDIAFVGYNPSQCSQETPALQSGSEETDKSTDKENNKTGKAGVERKISTEGEAGAEDNENARYEAHFQAGLNYCSDDIRTHVLRLSKVRQLSAVRRRNLLQVWLSNYGFWEFSEAQYQELDRQIMQAGRCCFVWSEGRVLGFRDSLWLLRGQPPAVPNALQWQPGTNEVLVFAHGALQASRGTGVGIKADLTPLNVHFRHAGERILLQGKHKTLKNVFQAYEVPVWTRPLLPLLFCGDRLVALADLVIADDAKASPSDQGWCFQWHPNSDYACYLPANS